MSKTIEPVDCWFSVYEHGTYEESSVLHGQPKRSFLVRFDSLREAEEAYPDAKVLQGSSKPCRPDNDSLADYSGLPATAPDWFDPAAAGERWDDDY